MKRFLTITALCVASIWQPSLAQEKTSQKSLTKSQQILNKVMEDIRHCDKTVRYEYDSKTRSINPPELKNIKGFRLKKIYRGIVIFEIDEVYEGLRAAALIAGRPSVGQPWPVHAVAFRSGFKTVRERLEQQWSIRLKDGLRPGPDVIYDGLYAEISMIVDGKERTLSVAKMPPYVYPHIAYPLVGCNHGDV